MLLIIVNKNNTNNVLNSGVMLNYCPDHGTKQTDFCEQLFLTLNTNKEVISMGYKGRNLSDSCKLVFWKLICPLCHDGTCMLLENNYVISLQL